MERVAGLEIDGDQWRLLVHVQAGVRPGLSAVARVIAHIATVRCGLHRLRPRGYARLQRETRIGRIGKPRAVVVRVAGDLDVISRPRTLHGRMAVDIWSHSFDREPQQETIVRARMLHSIRCYGPRWPLCHPRDKQIAPGILHDRGRFAEALSADARRDSRCLRRKDKRVRALPEWAG